ncbi:MAG: hypothetical protein ACRDIC_05495 [bacterium]
MSLPAPADLGAHVRVARGLVRHIFRPLTLEQAKAQIRDRLAVRDELFLRTARETIWQNPASPYLRLLQWAGWSYDALVDAVRRRGLESALEALRATGVYLSHEEFKGQRPIQRDGLRFECTEGDLDNPRTVPSFVARTGGTRSRGSRVPASFDYVADQRAPAWYLALEALGAGSWPAIIWMPAVSHGGGLMWWLALAHMGRPLLRWFSITKPSPESVSRRHRVMFRVGQIIGMARGVRVAYPEHASFADADVVLDAVLEARARYGGCAALTSPSTATRLAGLAAHRGVDLERVAFLVGGEPLTPGKSADIVRVGARVGARYSITEAGAVGCACGQATAVDDMHFQADSFALLSEKRPLPDGRAVDALILTTLLPSSPKIMLNVESDDFGDITVRRCECVWDTLGLHTHLSGIMSFSKLTGEGVTVLGTDSVRVIEEVLPREFGGRSLDYQLLEMEDEEHLTRLCLVVSPAVGPVDEERVLARFVEELRLQIQPRTTIPPMWRLAQTIKVIRRDPVPTAHGKLLPFHTLAFDSGRAAKVAREP